VNAFVFVTVTFVLHVPAGSCSTSPALALFMSVASVVHVVGVTAPAAAPAVANITIAAPNAITAPFTSPPYHPRSRSRTNPPNFTLGSHGASPPCPAPQGVGRGRRAYFGHTVEPMSS
jgi:hypothetical protein